MSTTPQFSVYSIELFERDVRLRMPFRFGVVTLTECPQAFVRARIRLRDGREAEGAAAEMLAPKWFDKNPALSNDDNFGQLRDSLRLARSAYLAGGVNSAFGHWQANYTQQIDAGAQRGLNSLVSCFGPALVDRALLDALCRALDISFYDALGANAIGAGVFGGIDLAAFLGTLRPSVAIAARHTVGLVDPLRARDIAKRVDDGLPESLDEVIERYGHRWFKLKVGGDERADIERLTAIAAVLERIDAPYRASLDGNEQYDDMQAAAALWRRMQDEPRLARLVSSIVFIEQPVKRQAALSQRVAGIDRPVIIDESDDSLDAFPRARALGYAGVSSKTCKGLYKSLINRARCAHWNAEEGNERYFMTGEDLTIQAGLALQQDLALVSLLGLTHVERNGHHYVNGMAALDAIEQAAFLDAHPDLYEHSHGAVRVRIDGGMLAIGSLGCTGYASGVMPGWSAMTEITP